MLFKGSIIASGSINSFSFIFIKLV